MKPLLREDTPIPGFYRTKLVKGGPWVAARIVCEDGLWWAEINGRVVATPSEDPVEAGVYRIWPSDQAIRVSEYDYLMNMASWAKAYEPANPLANPSQPIDHNKTPIPF